MKLVPITKDERSCRACIKFSVLHSCWALAKRYGKECEDFVQDKRKIGEKIRHHGT